MMTVDAPEQLCEMLLSGEERGETGSAQHEQPNAHEGHHRRFSDAKCFQSAKKFVAGARGQRRCQKQPLFSNAKKLEFAAHRNTRSTDEATQAQSGGFAVCR